MSAYSQVQMSEFGQRKLDRYQRDGNQNSLAILKKISPVAWQHIHFLGHYAFRNENPIDLAAMLVGLDIL